MKLILKPVEGEDDRFQVYRGGSSYNDARIARVSRRGYLVPSYRRDALGFRLARNK
jgi:formylglycine-generating enzyme required for sulfatase activity